MGEEYGAHAPLRPWGRSAVSSRREKTVGWRDRSRVRARERLRDPEVRRRPGERGRATIEARFALDGAAPHMLELLERYCDPNLLRHSDTERRWY